MCDRTQPGKNIDILSSVKWYVAACVRTEAQETKNSRCSDHKILQLSVSIYLYICVCTCRAGSLSKRINVYFCVGLSDSGVGEGPEGFWLQYARGNRVQHGSLHPKTG